MKIDKNFFFLKKKKLASKHYIILQLAIILESGQNVTGLRKRERGRVGRGGAGLEAQPRRCIEKMALQAGEKGGLRGEGRVCIL